MFHDIHEGSFFIMMHKWGSSVYINKVFGLKVLALKIGLITDCIHGLVLAFLEGHAHHTMTFLEGHAHHTMTFLGGHAHHTMTFLEVMLITQRPMNKMP
jgi:hypothetical protein